jgi:hypothetical protein
LCEGRKGGYLMRRKLVILAAAASIAGSIVGTAGPVSAGSGSAGNCPDGYTARKVIKGDAIDAQVDKNRDGIVCTKLIPSQGGGNSTGTLEVDNSTQS